MTSQDLELAYIPLIVLGLFFFIIGIIYLHKKRKYRKTGILINGFINKIYIDKNSLGIKLGDVIELPIKISKVDVTYIFNNQQYLQNIFYNQKDMKIGDLVEIYCNPYCPNKITAKKISKKYVLFTIFGFVLIIAGIVFKLIYKI